MYVYLIIKSMNKNNGPIISFKKIWLSYNDNDVFALRDVSFDIIEGEYICIVGHNGSGKSTISKVASGLIKPQKGEIEICNRTLTKENLKYLRSNIGVIFQNPDNQFIGANTEDDIAFGLENYKVPQHKMKNIIDKACTMIDVSALLSKESQDLSGGQKQKVAITSILALTPKIIIFDESTSMLDPQAKKELKELMKLLQTKYNKTVISITHDMEELQNATRILFMSNGSVLRYDTPQNMLFDQKFLVDNSLDVPFTLKLSILLNKKNKKIKPTLNNKELINQLCKI